MIMSHEPTGGSPDPHPRGRWTPPLDTSNRFGVGKAVNGEISINVHPASWSNLTREQALNLAAWLYVIAGAEDGPTFFGILNEIRPR
jgi:hypothetical protein